LGQDDTCAGEGEDIIMDEIPGHNTTSRPDMDSLLYPPLPPAAPPSAEAQQLHELTGAVMLVVEELRGIREALIQIQRKR
jgi:hypothetical protein